MIEAVPRTGDWRLVAPWYRWEAQGGNPRATRPAFQKYDSADFVNEFLANPQRYLRIDDTDDRVQQLVSKPAALFGGRLRALAEAELKPTATLKLFLPSHKRFYLVVCELHCEKAGFPNAHREEACQAGFVVRRRRFELGKGTPAEAGKLIRRVEQAVVALDELQAAVASSVAGDLPAADGGTPLGLATATAVVEPPFLAHAAGVLEQPFLEAQAELRAARHELRIWAQASGATGILEGWVAGADETGRWRQVKERPGTLVEATFPLYPLVPTPAATAHVGENRAIWFGVVPTSSADHDRHGGARLDERSIYEIRCFVRRHDERCPRNPVGRDCHGELTWSAPTERYQLASHFDLTGTANHPITVQLPDIPKLKAQAAALPIGKGAALKMVAPPGSSMKVKSQVDAKLGGAQICSMSIPLVTIVAQFVFSIFLPIVVAIFQLYALLRLKFCIPPSLSLDAGAMAALDLSLHTPDQIDADPAAALAVKGALSFSLGSDAAADTALQGYTPSALGPTVTASARPKAAARLTPAISARVYEEEKTPA